MVTNFNLKSSLYCLNIFFYIRLLIIWFFCNFSYGQLKKGIGLAESKGFTEKHLNYLQVSWYYNWGYTSAIKTNVEFVPMLFSAKNIYKIHRTKLLLTFNEPDNTKQAHINEKKALTYWHILEDSVEKISSPVMAKNPLKENSWLRKFMAQKPKIDFIAYHWYKGCNANKFIEDVKNLISVFGLPVWVTEFAPQTVADAKKNPYQYSTEEVIFFMNKVINWMNAEPMVLRFAWHDAKIGSSALFNAALELTETGKAYSQIK